MDSRAFGAFPTRTYRRTITVKPSDWLFLVAVLVGSAAIFAILAATGLSNGFGTQY
jgi:hypothetical protein